MLLARFQLRVALLGIEIFLYRRNTHIKNLTPAAHKTYDTSIACTHAWRNLVRVVDGSCPHDGVTYTVQRLCGKHPAWLLKNLGRGR